MKLYKPEYVYQEGSFVSHRGLLTENGKISEIASYEELKQKYPMAREVIMDGEVMVPGTVNVHNHSFQSLLRGIAADRPFLEWRDESLYRYSQILTEEDIYNGAVFAFGEMMKRGVTCVSDFFYLHNYGIKSDEAIIRAAHDVGIRLVLARTMYDWEGAPAGYVETINQAVDTTRVLAERYNKKEDSMVTILPAPHSLHAATPEMIQAGHALAKELGTCFHIHVAEEPFEVEQVKKEHGGLTTIEYLDTLGVVDEHMVIIHGVWLKPEEIELMGKRGAKLAYCPSSNMFLADGITDIPKFVESGVLIGLGSDGACSNNRISIFEEMRMVSILQKAKTCNAMCLNYQQAFDMGTKNGAHLLELNTGELKAGKMADFVGINLRDLSMMPLSESLEQMLPNLVYSMEPTAVKTVVVNGRQTVLDGRLLTMTEETIGKKVKETLKRMQEI
ncbi:MAG: amidohydrolase [Lachnospiraceae bacterium]|nr:amidohydrolase [Lachnospiraceae bacterium]MDD3615433.1 amidohydrolase [Lachnospiraceae bacterium]